jgi:N-acetylmuramoyl-L-alanine amidase
MKQTRESVLVGVLVALVALLYAPPLDLSENIEQYLSSAFFAERITPAQLHTDFRQGRLNILIVPGHDDITVGAQYRSLKETDLNAVLGGYLFDYLSQDKTLGVFRTRDASGKTEPWFESYINSHIEAIRSFREDAKEVMSFALREGHVSVSEQSVEHNTAADDASISLYGVNKWANESAVDLVIHVHFNDYPGRYYAYPGKYRGFAIYAPEGQLPNSRASMDLAGSIAQRLISHYAKSTFPGERDNVVSDQDLIAVGSNATRDGASLLIEYGYIYEPQLQNETIRDATLRELAYLTYRGITDYFAQDGSQPIVLGDTTLLPYTFASNLTMRDEGIAVLALQAALVEDGVYPPIGKSFFNCPLSGYFGECTKASVALFQDQYMKDELKSLGLTRGNGFVGSVTRTVLNQRHRSGQEL